MKRVKTKVFDYSPIALRALTRHQFAPATKYFTDRKKKGERNFCRTKEL